MTTRHQPIRTGPRRPKRRACVAVLPDRSSVRRCDPPATTRSGATDNCGARDLGRQRRGAERRGGTAGMTAAEPVPFREAVAAMSGASVRPEIELGPIRPPQRLAPYSYALGAEVKRPEVDIVPERSDGDAFGRLILLYDPEGADAWDGTMRLVARAEQVTALGGTVTATTSVRYGDISGPPRAHQLELRASWTALTTDIGTHDEAFCEVLEHAAGLPPVGVTDLGTRSRV